MQGGEQHYQCPTCKRFYVKRKLREHMANHVLHMAEEYVTRGGLCKLCQKYKSKDRKKTRRHIALVHNFVEKYASDSELAMLRRLHIGKLQKKKKY